MQRSKKRKLRKLHDSRLLRHGVPVVSGLAVAISGAWAQEAANPALGEIVVTATKREERLQDVPMSIQALGTDQLEQLHVASFEDYVQFLPSVTFTSAGPGFANPYFRGVANGENSNHSGPQPSVGIYLDEQPITTIQGAVDVHMYDIARVEALAGPQGTLYGASSQAGTIRIITNKPDPSGFEAGYDLTANTVSNGDPGYQAEGMMNIPITDNAAIRLVGWYTKDGGYIDNVVGSRVFPTSGGCITNGTPDPNTNCVQTPGHAKSNYNDTTIYGARAALRIELGDNWTITPTIMGQDEKTNGSFNFDPKIGDLELTRYYPENSSDKFWQAALTVEGKIGNFDLTYAGAYLKRDDVVNSDYSDYSYLYDVNYGSGAYWYDNAGVPLADPSQFIHGTDGYHKMSHELRLSSPSDWRLRFVTGLFYQDQTHDIYQNYQINGLADIQSITGLPGTLWLTDQKRDNNEGAVFGEVTFDFTDKLTGTAGARFFRTEDNLKGFFGFTSNYSHNYGEFLCFSPEPFRRAPCTNLDDKVTERGWVPKVNLTYKFNPDQMVYVTYSEGFRPGGINRNGTVPPYQSDSLHNYELGLKQTLADGQLRLNFATFFEQWKNIQFSFLPPSGAGLTVIRNAGDADIKGLEGSFDWAATEGLRLGGGFSLINAELTTDYIPDPTEPPTAPKGTSLPVTPSFKANLTARYQFNLGSFDSFVQAAGVYAGSRWSQLEVPNRALVGKLDAYTIADFSAGFTRNTISAELYLTNAFDERAQLDHFISCTTDVCGVNPYIETNQPRTIGIKFGQKFGGSK